MRRNRSGILREGESVSRIGGRESREGRYRNILLQTEGRRQRRDDRHDRGREKGRRNRGYDDMYRGQEVRKYRSTRVQPCDEMDWLMIVA
jgi:hypothetical protein